MRKHLKPFLNGICSYSSNCEFSIYLESGACPVAADLNVTHYLAYKTHFRKHRPRGALFNHWKYWTMLFTHAFNKGLIKAPVKIEFDEEKEDFRKRGQLIPDALFKAIIVSANRTWRHRAVVGRLCGQRPGVVRKLRKDQVDLSTGLMRVEKADSKNRRAYSFYLPPAAVRELQAQAERYPDSPYFFPNELDHSKPMDKHLKGWACRDRARAGDPCV
jgi:integrase